MRELDSVALTRDLPEHELKAGDVGTVVLCYGAGEAYEVEFLAGDGATIAVLTLASDDVRPLGPRDVFHVRTAPLSTT
jgi:hypothetical protein